MSQEGLPPTWKQDREVALGTVRNRKQDREEPQVTNKNNLARLGTVPNAETR